MREREIERGRLCDRMCATVERERECVCVSVCVHVSETVEVRLCGL